MNKNKEKLNKIKEEKIESINLVITEEPPLLEPIDEEIIFIVSDIKARNGYNNYYE